MNVIDRIKQWFSDRESEPVATPPAGSLGEPERETSTNAQVQGARDEPWPDEREP